jgi:predicted dehydrogenase
MQAYQDCSEVELVGLCGHRNVDRLSALVRKYEIPQHSLDLDELLDHTNADIVDIACNPHFRLAGVQGAMRPGVRLINLEKPMALTPEDAYEIERLCLDNGKLLTVNHQKKFLPAWSRVKGFIDSGDLGDIQFIRATCKGNLLEQGTHLIDMVMYYNSYCPISWVMGQIGELDGLDKAGAAAPDAAVATFCFENGVRAEMAFGSTGYDIPGTDNKWYHFSVAAYGTEGHAAVALNTSWVCIRYRGRQILTGRANWEEHYVSALTGHLDAAALYAQNPDRGHVSNLDNSLQSFQAIMAVYASSTRGGRIHLPCRFDDGLMSAMADMRRIP